MIHAGTISSGSARTVGVVGSYWISSISRLRNTTWPGVSATVSPGRKSSTPGGGRPAWMRSNSASQFCQPNQRLRPRDSKVLPSACGLVHRKFDGETMSSSCRATNTAMSSWCFETPRISEVALYHHCCCSRNDCAITLNGNERQSGWLKRRSWASGSMHQGASLSKLRGRYSARR